MKRQTKIDALSVIGFISLVWGVAIISIPAALIVAGGLIISFCFITEIGSKEADK